MWLDADTVIVAFDADPADCLEPNSYQALVAIEWGAERRPNCGVWLFRSGRRAFEFLDATWSCEQYIDDMWWENAAVVSLLGYSRSPCLPGSPTEWTSGTVLLDQGWNSIRRFRGNRPGRIHHYVSRSMPSRRWGARSDILHLAALESRGVRAWLLRIRSSSARACSEARGAWAIARSRQRGAVGSARGWIKRQPPAV